MLRVFFILLMLFVFSFAYASKEDLETALNLVNSGKNDEAISYIKTKLLTNEESADSYILVSIAYLEKNDYQNAHDNLIKAVEIKKNAVPAHYMLAMIYEKENQYDKAIAKWEKIYGYTKNDNLKKLALKHLEQLKSEIK